MKVPVFGPIPAASFHAIAGPVIVMERTHRCVENIHVCTMYNQKTTETAKRNKNTQYVVPVSKSGNNIH